MNLPSGEIAASTSSPSKSVTRSILANSEDGYLYRWDLAGNRFSERIQLTSGLAESYTPTAIGPDGAVYAINNAVLFSLGR